VAGYILRWYARKQSPISVLTVVNWTRCTLFVDVTYAKLPVIRSLKIQMQYSVFRGGFTVCQK